jgi:hypothetical protein
MRCGAVVVQALEQCRVRVVVVVARPDADQYGARRDGREELR